MIDRIKPLWCILCGLAFASAAHGAMPFELAYERLGGPLKALSEKDRGAVDQAIELIRSGNHTLALARLSALNQNSPENSSLRILTAYTQLQLGNLLGAFEQSERAEHAPNGNSYKCYFLGKIALLTGNTVIGRRELKHVKHAGDMAPEAKQLEQDLKAAKKKT